MHVWIIECVNRIPYRAEELIGRLGTQDRSSSGASCASASTATRYFGASCDGGLSSFCFGYIVWNCKLSSGGFSAQFFWPSSFKGISFAPGLFVLRRTSRCNFIHRQTRPHIKLVYFDRGSTSYAWEAICPLYIFVYPFVHLIARNNMAYLLPFLATFISDPCGAITCRRYNFGPARWTIKGSWNYTWNSIRSKYIFIQIS